MSRYLSGWSKGVNSNFFLKRFMWITFQVFVAIGLLIAALVYFEIEAEKEKNNNKIITETAEHSLYLSAKIGNLKKQVAIMQEEAKSYFSATRKSSSAKSIEPFIIQDSIYYSLDGTPEALKNNFINITGIGNFKERLKEERFRLEIEQQLGLSSLYNAIKKQHPELTWVYTISANEYLSICPFTTSYAAHYDETFPDYDIFKMGTPEQNPERKIYITPPYLDAGNQGLMVSVGAPVYENDEFRFIVGVDVTLSFLTSYVKNYREGTMIIINENNQILAHPTLIRDSDTVVRSLNEVLDSAIISNLEQSNFIKLKDSRIFVEKLSSVPWKILVITPPASLTLNAAIDRYYIVVLALIIALLFLVLFTYRHFIKPALDLVLFIDGHGNNKVVSPKKIHPSWQQWFNVVSDSFQKKREVIYHLDEEVKRKNAELLTSNLELMTQREQLVKEHQAKDKIFSIVSHDLKSPISSLVGILDLVGQGNISEKELKTLLPAVGLRVKRIKLMLENLLHWSICNLRAERIFIEQVDLTNVIRENVTLLEPFAEVKSITITFSHTEKHIVKTDVAVLNLVLRNLIFNAIKFSYEDSQIQVWFEITDCTTIYVKDHGCGIPKHLQSQLFTFGETGQDTPYEEKGTGLGLALCKEFLEKVNGTISFESESDKGTVFMFTIPNDQNRQSYSPHINDLVKNTQTVL